MQASDGTNNKKRLTTRYLRSAWLAIAVFAYAIISQPVAAQGNREDLERLQAARVPVLLQQRIDAQDRARQAGLPLRVEWLSGQVAELQAYIGNRPIYYITHNAVAADTVSTDEVHPGGSAGLSLNGSGETLGIWDGGSVRHTHRELTGRVVNNDAAGFSDHSTHVAGTMIASGVTAAARGMAFAASLRSWDFNDDVAEMITQQLSASPVIVSNHSYGLITGWIFNLFSDGLWVWFGDVSVSTQEDWRFGFYSDTARDVDELAYDSPNYVVVNSAGNDRGDGPAVGLHWHYDDNAGGFVLSLDAHPTDGGADGYDTLGGGMSSAKNILTIGAVEDVPGGYTAPGDVVMSSFSGWGPTDDGRIKPDLVANGVNLFSSYSLADNDYGFSSGTSMSSPNASGSLGVLNQHARALFNGPLTGATMRALAIHGADEAGATAGPDYSFGWGLMNTETTAGIMTAASLGQPTHEIHELTLTDNQTQTLFFNASASTGTVRVTAVWTDPAGTPTPDGLDPVTPMLINDLDIRLVDPNSTTHQPWILDPAVPGAAATTGDNFRDTVEQIVQSPPVVGQYRVDITHKGSLQGGNPQSFSLIISTGDAGPNQPPVVDAGADQTITMPAAVSLDSTVSDDGLPMGSLTTLWTQTSGPGTTTFADDTAVDTTATFSVDGVYVLRLTANDTDQTAFDELTVNACFFADVVCDGVINILDVQRVLNHFGLSVGDPGYNPEVDIVQDGTINILDVQAVLNRFGETAPF